ncbi:hypothetical protein F4778DRAFT_800753 [Xylariomycetidae sp. FL2044]|nr:hypothetical protein F4778DRAFT_800753 [Xylariomycetidae sp. FL2044]
MGAHCQATAFSKACTEESEHYSLFCSTHRIQQRLLRQFYKEAEAFYEATQSHNVDPDAAELTQCYTFLMLAIHGRYLCANWFYYNDDDDGHNLAILHLNDCLASIEFQMFKNLECAIDFAQSDDGTLKPLSYRASNEQILEILQTAIASISQESNDGKLLERVYDRIPKITLVPIGTPRSYYRDPNEPFRCPTPECNNTIADSRPGAREVVHMPEAVFPDGVVVAAVNDHVVLVSDPTVGCLFRVDTRADTYEIMLRTAEMAPLAFVDYLAFLFDGASIYAVIKPGE